MSDELFTTSSFCIAGAMTEILRGCRYPVPKGLYANGVQLNLTPGPLREAAAHVKISKEKSRNRNVHNSLATYTMIVQADWWHEVYLKGLGVAGGCLVTHAELYNKTPYIDYYQCAYVRRYRRDVKIDKCLLGRMEGYRCVLGNDQGQCHNRLQTRVRYLARRII